VGQEERHFAHQKPSPVRTRILSPLPHKKALLRLKLRVLLNCQRQEIRQPMKMLPSIALSEPYPLLDPGVYVAVCTEATFAWARQWNKWITWLRAAAGMAL